MELNPWRRLRRSIFALPLAAIAVLVVSVINESGYGRSSQALESLAERGTARLELQTLLRRLVDAESGQRGYLLTGRSEYLEPYRTAVVAAGLSVGELEAFYGREPQTREPMRQLAEQARAKLSELATTLTLYDSGRHDQWRELLMSNLGKEQMDQVRRAAEALNDAESARIDAQRQAIFHTLFLSRVGVHLMAAATLVALLAFLAKTRAFDRAQASHALALQAERDHLETQVARRTEDLTQLTRHLQTAREDERALLARELHDELGALLTAAKLDTARLRRSLAPMPAAAEERLGQLTKALDDGIALKRRIIEDLRPSSLSNLGLAAAIEILAREFGKRAEVRVQTRLEPVAIDESAEITVYRLVQESLTNVARYAKASEVQIEIASQAQRVHVEVRDNGVGFSPAATRRSAHGLMGMRYRVESEGGTMRVTSAPGQGTRIEAWLPCRSETTAPSA